ncbi:MAG: rRNA maturation RNase YbeY [Planctomycetes bacterium]|nr:rRNA maturation RNase YbeY [Planctomycetota bacterium]
MLAGEGAAGGVSLVFADDAMIRETNRKWLRRDRPTDVIAFPLEGPEDPILGEVMVSAETAAREALARGIPAERELLLYVVHGVLHVLGYEDGDSRSRRRMRAREARYLGERCP